MEEKKEKKDEIKKSQPVWDTKRKAVFVNGSKFKRAAEILALIKGERACGKSEDFERKEHYSRILATNKIDINSNDAQPALYEILGGLVRTPSEQKEADEKAKEARAKGRKRMIE
jgi:hypothetical protein